MMARLTATGTDPCHALRLEIAALTEENRRLAERCAMLERTLGADLPLPPELELTEHEDKLVAAAFKREFLTRDMAMHALYRGLGKDEPEQKIVDVFICKARKKLRRYGIEISTHHGQGYFMDAASKAKLKAMIDAMPVVAA